MSFHFMIVSHQKYSFISLCLKPEMWQKVAKFKGAEYFRKALYTYTAISQLHQTNSSILRSVCEAREEQLSNLSIRQNYSLILTTHRNINLGGKH